MLLAELAGGGREKVALGPFIKRAVLEEPLVPAPLGLDFAALRDMTKLVRVQMDVFGGLSEVEHFA